MLWGNYCKCMERNQSNRMIQELRSFTFHSIVSLLSETWWRWLDVHPAANVPRRKSSCGFNNLPWQVCELADDRLEVIDLSGLSPDSGPNNECHGHVLRHDTVLQALENHNCLPSLNLLNTNGFDGCIQHPAYAVQLRKGDSWRWNSHWGYCGIFALLRKFGQVQCWLSSGVGCEEPMMVIKCDSK